MKAIGKNNKHFNADEGKTFVNKVSGIRYGNDLYLCDEDSIDNYTEEPMTEDEVKAMEDDKNKKEAILIGKGNADSTQ